MEPTAGDPKSAEPDGKSVAEHQKSAGPGDKGADHQKITEADDKDAADFKSEGDQKPGVDGSGCGDKQVNAESLSSGSDDKRVPPLPLLPHDAGGGRSSSGDNKRGSGSSSAESEARPRSLLRADAPAFTPQRQRAPPVTPPPPRAPESHPPFPIPRPRAPPGTPSPPRVDATGGSRLTPPAPSPSVRTPSPSPSPTTPPSRGPSPCRSSSETRPHQHSRLGYSAVAQHGRQAQLEMEKNKRQMLEYLNSPDCDYSCRAANLGRRLEVDFDDLLQHNRELGIKVCKERKSNSMWMDEACKDFFKSKELPSDGVSLYFTNIPSRLTEATSFIESKDCVVGRAICDNRAYVMTATDHGREVADLLINRVLDDVADMGISWDGKLSLSDILFGEIDGKMKVYIALSPVYKSYAPMEPRLADLKSIWSMIENGCSLPQTNLPIYFPELKGDLNSATHLSGSFINYLRFHPALYGPTPRRYFLTSIQQVTRRMKLANDKVLGTLFSMDPLPDGFDWRTIASDGLDGPLQKLLNFQVPGNKKKPKNKSQYQNSTGSLLDYVKNGLSHLGQYVHVMDDDEIELFLALQFPKLLPDLMKGILHDGGVDVRFSAGWNAYIKTK